jgi:hypothetical protein
MQAAASHPYLAAAVAVPDADAAVATERAGGATDVDHLANMQAYVRQHLPEISAQILLWNRMQAPDPKTHFGRAAAIQAAQWGPGGNTHSAGFVVEGFVREECVRVTAAQASPTAVPGGLIALLTDAAGWRARLVTLNFWLQIVGAAGGLLGQFYINQRNATGFVCWIASNIVLIALQTRTKLGVLAVLHSIYLVLSVQGLYFWLQH